jgi:hypothetical protein
MTSTSQYAASLCIPRAFHKVTWQDVKAAFEVAFDHPGCVKKVDIVHREDDQGRPFKRIFVHFSVWPDNENASFAMDRMKADNGNGTFQIVYSDPWFWKCSLSRVSPPTTQNRPPYVSYAPKPIDRVKNPGNMSVSSGDRILTDTLADLDSPTLEDALRDAIRSPTR